MVYVSDELPERAILRMIHPNRQVAIDPLIVKVVVDANKVDVVTAPAQFLAGIVPRSGPKPRTAPECSDEPPARPAVRPSVG
jgi:hypothetical protein